MNNSSHGLCFFFALPWQVDEQGGNQYKGKNAQTSTNDSDSVHASTVILPTYASSSTLRTIAILRNDTLGHFSHENRISTMSMSAFEV